MKSIVENAAIAFRKDLNDLKAITGWKQAEIAQLLGCTRQTVSKLYNDPFSVNGRYILLVQEYLRREERKRYE